MNVELFIARRLLNTKGAKSVSIPIVRIALIGIVLGVVVMLLSLFITSGFKREITDKLSGFFSDIEISSYATENTMLHDAVQLSDSLCMAIARTEGVINYYPFITKPAILKSAEEIQGVVLKGVDSLYDGDFFKRNLVNGNLPDWTGEVRSEELLISQTIADLLKLQVGDKIQVHFIQDPPRVRQWKVAGIYATGFKEYDENFVLCDMRQLQRLNGWKENEVSGIAVKIKHKEQIDAVAEQLDTTLPYDRNDNFYRITTLRDQAPQIYDWLALLNMNVWIILILVVAVAGFNMVSGLFVLIIDKTAMIGVLKALGLRSRSLQKVFLYLSIGLIWKGVFWGNLIALLLGGFQYFFSVIPLDPVTYYMDKVPVHIDWLHIVLLDIGVITISTLMLIVPTLLIGRINPIEAIKFE